MINETTVTFHENDIIYLDNFDFDVLLSRYEGLEPCGWQLLIKIYIPPQEEKTAGGIIKPISFHEQERMDVKFSTLWGIVVKGAYGTYKDINRYELTGPYCFPGDWVYFPRVEGNTFCYNNMTSIFMTEDRILARIKDPRKIGRIKK